MKRRLLRVVFFVVLLLAAASGTVEAAPKAPVRIGAVLRVTTDDMSWSESTYRSLVALSAELGPDSVIIGYRDGQYKYELVAPTVEGYIREGMDIILVDHGGMVELVFEYAAQHPDITFVIGASDDFGKAQGLKNVFAYQARAEEAGYLNGLIAGLLTETGTVGVVACEGQLCDDNGEGVRYAEGFAAGATAARKNTKVKTIYTDVNSDVFEAINSVEQLRKGRADVVSGIGPHVTGMAPSVREAKLGWLSVQSSVSDWWPEIEAATQVYDWTPVLKAIIEQRRAGVLGGAAYEIGVGSGITTVYSERVPLPDAVREACDAAAAQIKAGKLIVPGNPKAAKKIKS